MYLLVAERGQESAWTAFRLLTVQCVSWERAEGRRDSETEALLHLQEQVCELVCTDLDSAAPEVPY